MKLPFVSMSASWFLVSTYLIWILGSTLILSNKLSSATLWVRDTCLIVGLRPLMIILITASLSSKMWSNGKVLRLKSHDRCWSIWGHPCGGCFFVFVFCFCYGAFSWLHIAALVSLDAGLIQWRMWYFDYQIPKIKSGNSIHVHQERISDSVELCDTEVCSLHIQLIGTNLWLPKMHNVPPDVDFESSRSPAKSESWNSPSLHCCAVFPTWQYCLYSLVWWM